MAHIPEGQIEILEIALRSMNFTRLAPYASPLKALPIDLRFASEVEWFGPQECEVFASLDLFSETGEETPPFRATLEFSLRASVEDAAATSLLKDFSTVNAIAVMIPYIRETLASITGRSGLPPLVLPPIHVPRLLELAAAESGKAQNP
jgi:preprotein translocase subunit SecB